METREPIVSIAYGFIFRIYRKSLKTLASEQAMKALNAQVRPEAGCEVSAGGA